MKACVFSIAGFSTDDGEGIRSCIFFKGCPLSCLWCHNAESIYPKPEISYSEHTCISCRACEAVCPSHSHICSENRHIFDRNNCIKCFACTDACPTLSLNKIGKYTDVAELFDKVMRDKEFYASSGGVTFTGGEPTMQGVFAAELAEELFKHNVSVDVETCGYCKPQTLEKLAKYTDTFLYDCKADSENHKRLTGVDDKLIISNLVMLHSMGKKIVLRCPVVEGGNLTDAFTEKISNLSQYAEYVHLLPYHNAGADKSIALGKKEQIKFKTPDKNKLSEMADKVKAAYGKFVKY